ncbi:hypothetical protein EAH79_16395 [Sphingomonas koreensis]|nr:hypothetical protein EAH79_16395 [Sphingomonas koreensis]
MTRMLSIRLTLSPIVLGVGFLAGRQLELPFFTIILALVATTLTQLSSIYRYVLIARGAVAKSVLADVSAPLVNFGLLAAVAAYESHNRGFSLSIGEALALYGLACGLTFVGWGSRLGCLPAWSQAVRSLLSGISKQAFAAQSRTIRRSIPVGLEQFTTSFWYNLPVILASVISPESRPVAALFQRLMNLIIAVLSVIVAADLRHFYSKNLKLRQELRTSLIQGAASFCIVFSAMYLCSWFLSYTTLSWVIKSQLARILPQLMQYKAIISLSFGFLLIYVRISFVALGVDQRVIRVIASVIGIAIIVVAAFLSKISGIWHVDFTESVIEGMFLGNLVGSCIMIARLRTKLKWF